MKLSTLALTTAVALTAIPAVPAVLASDIAVDNGAVVAMSGITREYKGISKDRVPANQRHVKKFV